MMDKKQAKLEVLQDLINQMRSKEKSSWKDVLNKSPESDEESMDDEEDMCPECKGPMKKGMCPECSSKKPGLGIIIAVGKGKKEGK